MCWGAPRCIDGVTPQLSQSGKGESQGKGCGKKAGQGHSRPQLLGLAEQRGQKLHGEAQQCPDHPVRG